MSHYDAQDDSQIECREAIKAALGDEGYVAFCRGCIIKYAWRTGRKGTVADAARDLSKAAEYADDAASILELESEVEKSWEDILHDEQSLFDPGFDEEEEALPDACKECEEDCIGCSLRESTDGSDAFWKNFSRKQGAAEEDAEDANCQCCWECTCGKGDLHHEVERSCEDHGGCEAGAVSYDFVKELDACIKRHQEESKPSRRERSGRI